MKDKDQISIVWCIDDVLHTAEEMDIKLTYRKHDANIGISWDVISIMIDIYLSEYNL
jgi:hypothetical protein